MANSSDFEESLSDLQEMPEDFGCTPKVSYIYSKQLLMETNKIPNVEDRADMVHCLIEAYGLLKHMSVIPSSPATEEDLTSFHSRTYVDFLKKVSDSDDLEKHEEDEIIFGLGYDCPLVDGIFEFVKQIAGGSLTAAQSLIDEEADIAINWCGGWHHAQRDEAEGFCYVNDVVIAIHKLREKFNHVLYIDLDVHHGDGVENAFAFTQKVFTVSVHKYEPGFFPGTGSIDDVGCGKGKYYSVNVPLRDGVTDEMFHFTFVSVMATIKNCFQPDAIVMQCGADCLTGDPMGTFNVTPFGIGRCLQFILQWKLPLLLLGGGGYNLPNAARLWTSLTSIVLNKNISSSIPDNKYFTQYGPDFELEMGSGLRPNENSEVYTLDLIQKIKYNLKNL